MTVVTLLAAHEHAATFQCHPQERLLYAGLRAGLKLPHECATGTCGSCKARVESGDVAVAWREAPAAQYLKPGGREVLLCQSYAISNCTVSVKAEAGPDIGRHRLPEYFEGRVRRSGMLTHDVLIMELALDRSVEFAAGQFALISTSGVEGFRAYSMVNQGVRSQVLELIVKRKAGGALTGLLFEKNLAGLEFKVFGPLGRATFDGLLNRGGDIVCAAGGTGIAGLMSILAEASGSGFLERNRAVLFFGVRSASDLFFLDRMADLRSRHPDTLRVLIATEKELPDSQSLAYPSLQFTRGLVHEALAAADFGDFVDLSAYIAGPGPAVEALTTVLILKHRLTPSRIRFDRFG